MDLALVTDHETVTIHLNVRRESLLTSLIIFMPTTPKDYSLKEEKAVGEDVYTLLFIVEKLGSKGTSHSQKMVADQRRRIIGI